MRIHDLLLSTSEKDVPRYSRETAITRACLANQLLHGQDSILRDSVELLMERGLRKLDGSGEDVTWTTDLRLRIPSSVNIVMEQAEHYAAQVVQCFSCGRNIYLTSFI